MPHELDLPKRLKAQGWKVKVREKERLEPPHVTILCKKLEWRVNLRDGSFLIPPGGSWNDIHEDVRKLIEASWIELREAWDKKYPSNPIASEAEGDGENG